MSKNTQITTPQVFETKKPSASLMSTRDNYDKNRTHHCFTTSTPITIRVKGLPQNYLNRTSMTTGAPSSPYSRPQKKRDRITKKPKENHYPYAMATVVSDEGLSYDYRQKRQKQQQQQMSHDFHAPLNALVLAAENEWLDCHQQQLRQCLQNQVEEEDMLLDSGEDCDDDHTTTATTEEYISTTPPSFTITTDKRALIEGRDKEQQIKVYLELMKDNLEAQQEYNKHLIEKQLEMMKSYVNGRYSH